MDEKALMQEAVNRNIYLFDNTNPLEFHQL